MDVRQVGGVHCRVVSCRPPWEFEECSTASATDNRTRDHNSDRLPQAFTAISAHHLSMGENVSVLGATVYGEVATAGGSYQRFQQGRISFRTDLGPRETVGPIATRYVAAGGEAGLLGFPVSRPIPLTGGASASRFERGRISHHPELGALELRDQLAAHYEALGAEAGALGFPVTGHESAGRGARARFQGGRISWSQETGVHATRTEIAARYAELGGETGPLGFPVAQERQSRSAVWKRPGDRPDRRSDFEHGSLVLDASTGTVQLLPEQA